MGIVCRLKNSYSYGGIKEIFRKFLFLIVYKINNLLTLISIKKTAIEYGLNKEQREETIIVSLTTFPARFPRLFLCLKSLVVQKFKPDKIIIYLGSDTSKNMLTEEMYSFEQYGIEYRFDAEKNLMPHKKYFYAMQEYPNAIIVTADDDVVYPKNWLDSLYKSYKKYPTAVSARRVHLIKRIGEKLAPYDHWEDQCRQIKEPSLSLMATGNSGILYPPHCLDSIAFNADAIKALCLKADDIWLKCMEIKKRIPVVWVKNWEVSLPSIDFKHNKRLSDENIFNGNNDYLLCSVMEYCDIDAEDFFENSGKNV